MKITIREARPSFSEKVLDDWIRPWLNKAERLAESELAGGIEPVKGSLDELLDRSIETWLREYLQGQPSPEGAKIATGLTAKIVKELIPNEYSVALEKLSKAAMKPGTYKVHGVYKNDGGYFDKRKSKRFVVQASSAAELLRNILVKLGDDAEDLQEFDSRYASKIKTKQDVVEFLGIREEGEGYQVVSLTGPNLEYKSPNY